MPVLAKGAKNFDMMDTTHEKDAAGQVAWTFRLGSKIIT
jgi:hypothetical protein